MAARLLVIEAANLYAGDDGPNNSKHLTLQSVKLPDWREKTQEHHPGGSIGAITLGGFGIEAQELSFKLVGSDPQTRLQFGLGSKQIRPYTIYASVRDKETGRAIERKAVVRGRLVEMSSDEIQRGSPGAQDHKIAEITHYEEFEDKQEIYFWDFWSQTWRVGGIDQNADERAILRL